MNWIELAIDYISNLESNEGNINEMSMRIGFKFEQLEKFLDSRYNYILELNKK